RAHPAPPSFPTRRSSDHGLAQAGLELVDAEALREHYAKTLWCWLDGLEANAVAARAEVGEEKFRVWRIYLAGSAHAFERGWLSIDRKSTRLNSSHVAISY